MDFDSYKKFANGLSQNCHPPKSEPLNQLDNLLTVIQSLPLDLSKITSNQYNNIIKLAKQDLNPK